MSKKDHESKIVNKKLNDAIDGRLKRWKREKSSKDMFEPLTKRLKKLSNDQTIGSKRSAHIASNKYEE